MFWRSYDFLEILGIFKLLRSFFESTEFLRIFWTSSEFFGLEFFLVFFQVSLIYSAEFNRVLSNSSEFFRTLQNLCKFLRIYKTSMELLTLHWNSSDFYSLCFSNCWYHNSHSVKSFIFPFILWSQNTIKFFWALQNSSKFIVFFWKMFEFFEERIFF